MAKYLVDAAMDAALDYIATADRLFVCSAQPASYSEAASTYDLATHTLTGADFTKDDGDVSGRKLTIAEQASIAVDHSGDATHVALGISGSTTLVYATTCTTQTLTAGNTVTVPAFDVDEITDIS